MIEVNLLPGGKKRQSRGPRLSLPDFKGVPIDRWVLGTVAGGILGVGAIGYLFVTTNSRSAELSLAVEAAARDSIRVADLSQQIGALQARRDSIAEKVAIIQEIDSDRYVWPHLLDEIGRALPEFVWLTEVLQLSQDDQFEFRIAGRAGNNFALTEFWRNLDGSPFINNVRLSRSEQILETGPRGERVVHEFVLEMFTEDPPPEILKTVPLFAADDPAGQ